MPEAQQESQSHDRDPRPQSLVYAYRSTLGAHRMGSLGEAQDIRTWRARLIIMLLPSPLALAGLGAGGAVFSGLGISGRAGRPYLLSAAVLVLLTSWVMFFRRRAVACNTDSGRAPTAPAKRTAVLLSIGTAFVALSLVWDALIEPIVFKLVR